MAGWLIAWGTKPNCRKTKTRIAQASGARLPINRLFRDEDHGGRSRETEPRLHAYPARPQPGDDPVSEIVARKVIDINAAGTHDPKEIATLAIKQLGLP
jgi:hypothetical protein